MKETILAVLVAAVLACGGVWLSKKYLPFIWQPLFSAPAPITLETPERRTDMECEYNMDDLLRAIAWVESGNDPDAVGDGGKAVGKYQIHPIYVKDVNRILCRPEYSLYDRYNPIKSKEMVIVYLRHYGRNRSIEDMARIHNGGPKGYKKKSTEAYWAKIKAVLK